MEKQPESAKFDVNYREVMVAMRDGVRLQSVIISPKNAKGPLPILLRRTPYGVPDRGAAEEL